MSNLLMSQLQNMGATKPLEHMQMRMPHGTQVALPAEANMVAARPGKAVIKTLTGQRCGCTWAQRT